MLMSSWNIEIGVSQLMISQSARDILGVVPAGAFPYWPAGMYLLTKFRVLEYLASHHHQNDRFMGELQLQYQSNCRRVLLLYIALYSRYTRVISQRVYSPLQITNIQVSQFCEVYTTELQCYFILWQDLSFLSLGCTCAIGNGIQSQGRNVQMS